MTKFLTILLTCVGLITIHAEDERIFVDAEINGWPVRLVFDTGDDGKLTLLPSTAQVVGLKFTSAPPNHHPENGSTTQGLTEPCNVVLFGTTNSETTCGVIENPADLIQHCDGFLGWPALTNNILSLDFNAHTINGLTNIPPEALAWVKLRTGTNSGMLTLQMPDGKILDLDSGSPSGIRLDPQAWHQWKAAHTNQPLTVGAYFTPNPGLVVVEEAWADKISIGPLTFTEVPVTEATSTDVALNSLHGSHYEATLGFAALKRLDIIIDGKHGIAYLRPKATPPPAYEHNRLGAVFVPRDLQSDDLIAHVIKGSPAFEAGIRDGDILLKEGERDVTNWRDPNVLINTPFKEQPAGAQVELTLKRGGKIYQTTARLRNIVPPDAPKSSN